MGTKKPKITSISRDGNKFIVRWKHGEKGYTAQDVDFYVYLRSEATFNKAKKLSKKDKALKKWDKKSKSKGNIKFIEKIKVKKNSNSASYTLNPKSYYPTSKKPKVTGVEFRVRGKKGGKWSSYDYKVFDIDNPKTTPSASPTLGTNYVDYSIGKPKDKTHNPVYDVYWKKVIVPNCGEYKKESVFKAKDCYDKDDGDFTGNSKVVKLTAKNYLVTPQTAILWAQARNMSGTGPWRKVYHTFANPAIPQNVKVLNAVEGANKTIDVTMQWSSASDKVKQPTDTICPQYSITPPNISYDYVLTTDTKIVSTKDYYEWIDDEPEGSYEYVQDPVEEDLDHYYEMVESFEAPSEARWQDAFEIRRKTTDDSTVITVPNLIPVDNCLFVRVKAVHDGNPVYSESVLAKKGKLSAPSITDIQLDDSDPCTYKATVTAKNNSSVSGTFIAIVYNDSGKGQTKSYNGKVLAVIESGESVSFQCPKWENLLPLSFGAYAIYGEINQKDTVVDNVEDLDDPIIQYAFYEGMASDVSYMAGSTPNPVPASSVNLTPTNIAGTVQVSWNNPWLEATGVEISWADHDDAWYSTDGPSTFTVDTIQRSILNISGLEEGKRWYIRVRFFKVIDGGGTIYGPYSKIYDLNLTQKPAVPILEISSGEVVNLNTDITASWIYVTNDGTEQDVAELQLVETLYSQTTDVAIDQNKKYYILENNEYIYVEEPVVEDLGNYYEVSGYNYHKFLSEKTARHITFKPSDDEVGWNIGSSYTLALRVHSESGNWSDFSNMETIRVAEPPTCTATVSNTNFGSRTEVVNAYIEVTEFDPSATYYIFDENNENANDEGYVVVQNPVESDIGQYYTKDSSNVTTLYLTRLPLIVDVTGAGEGGTSMISIVRYAPMELNRPDESDYEGYEGEIIYQESLPGDGQFEITLDKLKSINSRFDDGGVYAISAAVQDISGLIDTNDDEFTYNGETYESFAVSWEHQAVVPEAVVTIIDENVAEIKAMLPETLPAGWSLDEGDSIDIYRLSAGKPELLISGAKLFDPNNPDATTYIDPFPTIGKRGGYRVVFITVNGDYYAPVEDSGVIYDVPAWTDVKAGFDSLFQYINFGDQEIEFRYNVKFSNSWNKQFTGTRYLGGSYIGDWLNGTDHTNNISGVTLDDYEEDTLNAIYDLAEYNGRCRVRTIEGANYSANITVSDSSEYNKPGHPYDITLNVTKIDSTFAEGMTKEDWEAE